MIIDEVREEYFRWLYNLVSENRYADTISYRKLLRHLHDIEFTYSIRRDKNRAEDGMSLRYRFAMHCYGDAAIDYVLDILDGPCSVLEMMVGLAVRCEKWIMDDPRFGDRTGQWFWNMITNLGLGSVKDERYDARVVDIAIKRLLNREYEPDGEGGLFRVKNCDVDMRSIEIWRQLSRYVNSIM